MIGVGGTIPSPATTFSTTYKPIEQRLGSETLQPRGGVGQLPRLGLSESMVDPRVGNVRTMDLGCVHRGNARRILLDHLWKRLAASPSKAAIQNDPLPRNDYFFERDEREPRSGERPRTVLGFSSFGESEMPSNTLAIRANLQIAKTPQALFSLL
jgi:hypothetical protein